MAANSGLIPRSIRPLVVEGIDYSRIVFVAGARQVGKTTLVGDIAAHERPMTAFTLDDRATREAAIADPGGFVAELDGPAFIDEIHRAPGLLLELKKAVDADTTPGRFVITGSANVLASRRIQDALPGRIDRVDMWPLAQSRSAAARSTSSTSCSAGVRRVSLTRRSAGRPSRRWSPRAATPRRACALSAGCGTAGSPTTSPRPWRAI